MGHLERRFERIILSGYLRGLADGPSPIGPAIAAGAVGQSVLSTIGAIGDVWSRNRPTRLAATGSRS